MAFWVSIAKRREQMSLSIVSNWRLRFLKIQYHLNVIFISEKGY